MKYKILLLALPMFITTAFADTSTPPVDPNAAAKISVDAMKEKYWEKTTDVELRVVQNRRYTQYKKFELQLFGGTISTDPFLAVKNLGGSLSYHFNDYFAAKVLGFKDIVGNSSALSTLQQDNNTTANTNEPKYFIGGEVDFVPLYGKFSLMGNAIVYVDTHIDGGLGETTTQTGHDLTPFLGLGEQFYLNRWSSFNIDYRLMYYRETLDQKTVGQPNLGGPIDNRASWNDVITLGISVFGSIL